MQCQDHSTVSCRIKGNFRIRGIRTTNPVAVGDIVMVNDAGMITEILPRKNYIIRRASNLSKQGHIIAANLDQVCLIATLSHPETSLTFIDRFLATAQAYNIPAVLVINKTDLLTPELKAYLDQLSDIYSKIGYPVLSISAKTGHGLQELREMLANKLTLFSGNSGVGKSTLVNDLVPSAEMHTSQVSQLHDTGTHTTTFSEMFAVPGVEGARIIDTPGVKGFGTLEFETANVGHYFPEIFRASSGCKYGDCTHTHEPGCAVIQALEEGQIAPSRYNSYLSILEDEDQGKYRKPF